MTTGESRRRARVWRVAVASVAVLGFLGVMFWFVFVPNWRPPLREGEAYGIDVSHHQDKIAWDRVADDGIGFAYIKATEGGDHTDRRFAENWRGAGTVGLERGAYHFFTLCRPGGEQARWFLSVAPPDPHALPPAVDLELAGNCSARPSAATVAAELDAFLHIVEDAWGREMILYLGDDFDRTYAVRDRLDRPLWQRRFLLRPRVDGWVIWQLHGYAHVEGIDGDVDLNVVRRDALGHS